MPRTFSSTDLVQLPRLDAHEAVALASSVEAGCVGPATGKRDKKLAATLIEVVDEIATDRAALQAAVAKAVAPPTPTGIRAADRLEDRAVKALIGLFEAWANIDEEQPLGALGARLNDQIFGSEGRSITQLPVKQEWAVVDSKLRLIEEQKLDAEIAQLGGTAILAHLKKVHIAYGLAVGTTKTPDAPESPDVAEKLAALLDSLRSYIVRVAGLVSRKRPETQALAERLLKPITNWVSPKPAAKAQKPAPGTQAATAETAAAEKPAPAAEKPAADAKPSTKG